MILGLSRFNCQNSSPSKLLGMLVMKSADNVIWKCCIVKRTVQTKILESFRLPWRDFWRPPSFAVDDRLLVAGEILITTQ